MRAYRTVAAVSNRHDPRNRLRVRGLRVCSDSQCPPHLNTIFFDSFSFQTRISLFSLSLSTLHDNFPKGALNAMKTKFDQVVFESFKCIRSSAANDLEIRAQQIVSGEV